MPMDKLYYYDNDMSFADHCLGWKLTLSLLPRRCYYSNKFIWLTWAYRGTAMWTGPGEPVFEHRWVDRKEYLLLQIKGKV